MKYLISLILIGLMLYSCNKVDAVDTMLKARFDYNNPVDKVDYYSLFVYEAEDTLTSPFIEDSRVTEATLEYFRQNVDEDTIRAAYPDDSIATILFSVSANGEWVQIGLTASNSFAQSLLAVSGWFKKDLMIMPQVPSGLIIEEE